MEGGDGRLEEEGEERSGPNVSPQGAGERKMGEGKEERGIGSISVCERALDDLESLQACEGRSAA